MATGTKLYEGLALPAYGEALMTQQSTGYDVLTLQAASGSTDSFVVCQTSAAVQRFSVGSAGAITIVSGAAADNLIKATQASTPTGDVIQILNNGGSKVFQVDSGGKIATMCITTVALTSLASNGSGTATVTGITTNHVVGLFARAALGTTSVMPTVWVDSADKIGYCNIGLSGLTVPAMTAGVWFFRTASN